MKRLLFFLGFALFALLSCSKDEEPPTIQYSFSDVNASPNFTSCVITCSNKSIDDKEIHARLLLSEAEDLKDATTHPIQVYGDTLICSLTGLSESTVYYFGFEIFTNTETYRVKDIYSFKTWEGIGVRVTTFEITNITGTTALGGGNATIVGDVEISERGICWSTQHNPDCFQEGHAVAEGSGSGWFSVNMTGLVPETTYYVRAYVYYSNGIAYGNEISFTTLQLIDCNVSVSANPDDGGTVSGEGTYQQGESCTVTATANNGYSFVNWTEDDVQVSANEEYTFTVDGDRTLVANFSASSYIVSAAAEPEEGGTVSGSGGYEYGDNCTLKAIANTGYTFEKWTENGNVVSTNANYTFTVDSNRSFVANFTQQAPQDFIINVSVDPNDGGTVTGDGIYQQGQQCTVKAIANTGYTFVRWTEGGIQVSAEANYTFTVNGNRTLVAHFTASSYVVSASANPEEGGTITGAGGYEYGQNCTLRATANTGYTFTKWTENGTQVSANANYTFTVTGSRSLVAHFQTQSYTITASADPTNGGTVSGSGTYDYGQSCTMKAVASNGYTFVNWTENGNQVSANANYTFTVNGNRTMVAHFTASTYVISASANPEEGGTITGAGGYEYGQNCTLSATANPGYNFTKWTENGTQVSTNANYTFTVTGSRSLVAHFQIQSYTITASANPSNGGTVSGGGTFDYGQSCTVNATAATGYTFVRWTENGNQVSTNANYTFTVTGDRNLLAQFQQQSYTISVSANPTSGGSVTGGGTFNYGQSCTVSATAATGYTFVRWTENGNQVSTNANYTFTVNGNRNLVAQFQQQTYTISVSASPNNGGSVSGGGTYNYGQSCTVHATANSGYSFTNWTENGNVVSTNANYTFTVTGNRTLVTNFTANPQNYTISVSANPSDGGTVSGGGTYQQGQSCTVGATAATGYTFVRWTENGNQVSTNANYTFTVTSNRTLVAQFQQQTYTISVSASPSNGGSVSGGGTYNYGQSCTVHATANSNYTFTNWTENGNVVSTNANYTFTVNNNRTLVANFTVNPQNYTISVSANPTNGGTVSGGGTYQQGQSCTVGATAATGYTFVRWTENGNQVSTSANYTFTVNSNRTLVANFTFNGGGSHEYVDLGLPSGLLWATCNVGADSPEDYGDYFAWGETESKSVYNWSTYQHCNGSGSTLTKYCNYASYGYNGFTDNLTTLLSEDDAVTVNWGADWRMPTNSEWRELRDNTTQTWITQDGVRGELFIASNGNSLFLPAAGYYYESSLREADKYGTYWSSSLIITAPNYASTIDFRSDHHCNLRGYYRYFGYPVRAVRSNRK